MRPTEDLLTPSEAAYVAGVPLKHVYKVARERLPHALRIQRNGRLFFKLTAAVCFRIDRELPKDVPLKVRRAFYGAIEDRHGMLERKVGTLSYLLDPESAEAAVATELAGYRAAMGLVREDPEVQAGAATFVGTRILVHTIADLLASGISVDELKADYPNLTEAMLVAAPVYARIHPRRGRPRIPRWRNSAPGLAKPPS